MSVSLLCPRCGFRNEPGYQFCTNCGTPFTAAPGTPVRPAPPVPYAVSPGYGPGAGSYATPMEYERMRQVDRTKTGILLILVGTLLSWVPFLIDVIGYLLIFIGLVLLILGRKAFGRRHSRNSVVTMVLLFLGLGVIIGSALPLGITVAMAQLSSTLPTAAELTSEIQLLLVGEIVGAVAFGLMSVLFTYALQKQEGQLLLFAGFGAAVALSFAVYLIVTPLVPAAVAAALSGGTFDSAVVTNLQNLAGNYGLLNAIPALLFAVGEYLAWSRINRGEIPVRLELPEEPPVPPGFVGSPPQAPPSGPAPPLNPR